MAHALMAQASRRFPMRQWRWALLTDKSHFTLFCLDGQHCIYRRHGEYFTQACVVKRDRFGGISVMVWGDFSHGVKSQLIVTVGNLTAVRYRDEVFLRCSPSSAVSSTDFEA